MPKKYVRQCGAEQMDAIPSTVYTAARPNSTHHEHTARNHGQEEHIAKGNKGHSKRPFHLPNMQGIA